MTLKRPVEVPSVINFIDFSGGQIIINQIRSALIKNC